MQDSWKGKIFLNPYLFLCLHADYPACSTTSQERNRENVFLELTAVHGCTEKGREHMQLPYRNTERTSGKAPAAPRGNIAVPEYRKVLFREKNIYF